MKKNGFAPDIQTYNSLLHILAHPQYSRPLEAWAVLDDMLAVGVAPNVMTFNHLIKVEVSRV